MPADAQIFLVYGRMSVLMGGYYLGKQNGGSGVLLGGVPGVLPGRVVVLGGGAAGRHRGSGQLAPRGL